MTTQVTTADVETWLANLCEVQQRTANQPRHLSLVPPLDDEQVANEMRLEQAGESRRDAGRWGRDHVADWRGESR